MSASVFDLVSEGGRFGVEVPEGWSQGRGAFGGLVVGWLARAVEASEPDPERTIRSLSAELVGPARRGPALVEVTTIREGSGVATRAAMLRQGAETCAHAVFTLGRPRVADRDFSLARPPPAPPLHDVEVAPVRPPFGPEFAQHFEFRPVLGLPLSEAGRHEHGAAATVGYVRFLEPPERVDAAFLAAIADAHWPSIYVTEETLRPMATLSFRFDLTADPARLDPAQAFLVSTRAIAGRDGFVVEDRQVFGSDGALVGLNRQTFVIIK